MRASAIAGISVLVLVFAAPAIAQQRGEDESAELVDEGRRALRARKYGDAAEALDQAIALNPRRIEAYVLRAAVHAARQEYPQGIKLLRKARGLAPDNADVLAALGAQLVAAGEADEGVIVLEKVVAADPARYDAQSVLGLHRARADAWKPAIVALEAYLAHRPAELAGEDADHQLHLAEAYLRAGRPGDARDLYAKLLEVRGKDPAARMGHAWALAAIDCTKALPALGRLDDLVADHPEILLVRGQCQLALDDASKALALGQRYLARQAERGVAPTAAGHALVGEAAAAVGDLELATSALADARDLEPTKRRWGRKLATVLRRSGDGKGAVAELDRMGAPASPGDDPAWWRELGEALIVAGEHDRVAGRLAGAVEALPEDAALRTIAGEAALRAGDVDAAQAHLDAAERAGSTPRSRAWLARTLEVAADARIAAGELEAAEPLLARADQLGGGAGAARNLGIVRLALGKGDAVTPLERAAEADPSLETLLALGQAHAVGAEGRDRARAAYARAAKAAKGTPAAVLVAIDRAALELDAGQAGAAVDAIEVAAADAKEASAEDAAAYRAAAQAARHAAGIAALRAGSAGRAVDHLEAADKLAGGKDDAIRCDLALATVATGDRDAARKRLRAVAKVTCPFPAPADTQAVPILIAFIDGLDARRADKALAALGKLGGKATGVTRRLLATATRVVAIVAADQAYRDGKLDKARKLLGQAKKAETRAGADEVTHNLAVLDVAAGKLDAATAALEKLAPELPEALVNLGVAADRRGDGDVALERWRQALRAGVRFAPLEDWIAAKERIYGGEP